MNTSDFFQRNFDFTSGDKRAYNQVVITAAIIAASIYTGGAAAGGVGGINGAIAGGIVGGATGAVIGAVGYPALGLGDSHEGMLYGLQVGAVGGALGGFGPANAGNYLLRQWDLATGDTWNYFFSSNYGKGEGLLGGAAGGFPKTSIGSTILFVGIIKILDDLK